MNPYKELIQKYNRPGPRYTSYPPLPFWHNTPNEEHWFNQIKTTYQESEGVDLYVHVPYCESLCYYCGCNRTITKDHAVEEPYVNVLLKEWEIYCHHLGFVPKINSLHFGGGTPTFLSPYNLERIIKILTQNKAENFIGSIEIDPRTCLSAHLEVLERQGFQRVSLGIQDFDSSVQGAIHRHQSPAMIEQLVEKIRFHKIQSINFDLIYGLPKQTVQSIEDTIRVVTKIKPDLIAFYSYAHLPDRIKNQRLIKNSDLPGPELKNEIYEKGKDLLKSEGYLDIGMDHFARSDNFLFKAKEQKRLHRNFMGYVDKKSSILIGLGPTAISDSSLGFIQNEKDINQYQKSILQGHLAIHTGHTHSELDLYVQKLILELMCQDEMNLSECEKIPHWCDIQQELNEFVSDGLIKLTPHHLGVTPLGKNFIRNLAMCFDFYLRSPSSSNKFSQTI